MVSKSYRDYVERRGGGFHLAVDMICDVCGGQSYKLQFGTPILCADHARELGLLW